MVVQSLAGSLQHLAHPPSRSAVNQVHAALRLIVGGSVCTRLQTPAAGTSLCKA